MPISFTSLAQKEIARIFRHLDLKTVMILRNVSKNMRESVDAILFKSQKILFYDLAVDRERGEHKTCVTMRFSNLRHCLISRNCFNSAFDMLKINVIIPSITGKILSFKLESEEIRRFFGYLKPLIQNKKIDRLSLMDNESQVVLMCLELLEGKCIPEVFVIDRTTDTIDFSPLLTIVQQVRPELARFTTLNQTLADESFSFVLQLADIVKSLLIVVESRFIWSYPSIVSIIIPLLKRNCEQLDLTALCPNNLISLAHAEKLLQYLNHSGKKVSVRSSTAVEPIDVQIGVYKLKTAWRQMTVKHFDNSDNFD